MHHLGPFGTFRGLNRGPFPSESYWGFPVDQGTWMPDWDCCYTEDAVHAAKKVARKLWFQDLLDMVCSEQKLGFAVSAKAMARLLDIAILTGNKEAARVLHGKCALLPLRRWYSAFFTNRYKEFQPSAIPILRAALAAGIDFSEVSVCFRDDGCEWIPFSQALFLLSTSLWMELCGFLPPSPWQPEHKNNLAGLFLLRRDAQERPDSDDLNRFKLDTKKLQNAGKAEVDLRCIKLRCTGEGDSQSSLSLLDLAIVWGQPDCAEICASMDMELTDFGHQPCWDALYCVSADFRALYFYSRHGLHPLRAASRDACFECGKICSNLCPESSTQTSCHREGICTLPNPAEALRSESLPAVDLGWNPCMECPGTDHHWATAALGRGSRLGHGNQISRHGSWRRKGWSFNGTNCFEVTWATIRCLALAVFPTERAEYVDRGA